MLTIQCNSYMLALTQLSCKGSLQADIINHNGTSHKHFSWDIIKVWFLDAMISNNWHLYSFAKKDLPVHFQGSNML